jgi:hypothetical protein
VSAGLFAIVIACCTPLAIALPAWVGRVNSGRTIFSLSCVSLVFALLGLILYILEAARIIPFRNGGPYTPGQTMQYFFTSLAAVCASGAWIPSLVDSLQARRYVWAVAIVLLAALAQVARTLLQTPALLPNPAQLLALLVGWSQAPARVAGSAGIPLIEVLVVFTLSECVAILTLVYSLTAATVKQANTLRA